MLLATIVAGIGAVIYFIWVGKRMGKTSALEKSMKSVGEVHEMALKVDKKTQETIKNNNGTGINIGFPRLPRDK
jgi:hypothetical protein